MTRDESNLRHPIYAPLTGEVKPLHDVPDPTFSEKMMGDGMAIEPLNGKVVAPVEGEVINLFPTKHAVGILSEDGIEILIHIGLETVSLEGKGFEAHVEQGDHVKVGEPLLTFDLDFIKRKAKSIITPIIVTNGDILQTFEKTNETSVTAGESALFHATIKDEQLIEKSRESEDKREKTTDNSTVQYGDEARDIVTAVGGKENIDVATHCVTRLRFSLADEDKVDKEALENLSIVKGLFSSNGQFQVIIGQGTVDKVYAAMVEETGISEATKEDVKRASSQKQNVLQRGIKVLADIFIPILPAIVTAGLLLGLNNILVNPIFTKEAIIDMYPQWSGIAEMINIIANTAFTLVGLLLIDLVVIRYWVLC